MLNNQTPTTMVTCGKLVMTPVNGRTVRLTGDLTKCEKEGTPDITKLTYDNGDCEVVIQLGEQVYPRPKSPYKVNIIKPGTVGSRLISYELMVALSTNSSIFVFPFLTGNRKLYMWDTLFVNAFIGTPEHENCICLLYRYSGESQFVKFESALRSFRHFRDQYEPDTYHTMFVFDVPDNAKASYEHYINGRYSEIDDLWKLKILEFHDFDIDGQVGKILFQSESLRKELEQKLDVVLPPDSELHDRPNLEKEIFDPEYYALRPKKLR